MNLLPDADAFYPTSVSDTCENTMCDRNSATEYTATFADPRSLYLHETLLRDEDLRIFASAFCQFLC